MLSPTLGSRFVAGLAGSAMALTTLAVATPAEAAPTQLTIIAMNDFHGRIDSNTTKWATTIEQIRATSPNNLLVGAGDLIGASLFASANQEDEPTVKVMNAMGLDVSALGNHEFDRGESWLRTNVLDGKNPNYTAAKFDYLGANVTNLAGDPAFEQTSVKNVGGAQVCTVGAVTQETPSLVTPDGVKNLKFLDPVTQVNRAVEALKAAGTTCDVTVATYHEGAGPNVATLDEAMTNKTFAGIVNNTDPSVDVIINGHTHKSYSYSAPIPGGGTRPVIQAGEYGNQIGKVDLTVDNGTITASAGSLVSRVSTAAPQGTYPRVDAVKPIVDSALAAAAQIGNKPVGRISRSITTAYAAGTSPDGVYTVPDPTKNRDQRQLESTLGNLVADALKETPIEGQPTPDLAIVNPGGLRAELLYAGDTSSNPENTNGVVTFAEADAVLPFANNVNYVKMTGAVLKEILEQQWQRDKDGNVPSRPFLHLGVSKGLQVTLNAARPEGDRVTGIKLNGKPVTDDQSLTVSTFSFLAAGGDNFRAFTKGVVSDTGKLDRDLWIDGFFKNGVTKRPDFARRQVFTDVPKMLTSGRRVEFSMDKLDLTSLGTPMNNDVTATLHTSAGDTELGTFPVINGRADLAFTMPRRVPAKSEVLLSTDASKLTVSVPAGPTLAAAVATEKVVVKQTKPVVEATVTSMDGQGVNDGTVQVFDGDDALGAAVPVSNGTAKVTLPSFSAVGSHTLRAVYSGGASVPQSEIPFRVSVVKATPAMTVTRTPSRVVRKKTKPVVTVAMSAQGQSRVGGNVVVSTAGRSFLTSLSSTNRARFVLPAYATTGAKTVTVRYLGNDSNNAVTRKITVRVVRR